VEELATKLEIPGSLAFAPDGRLFFTERPGRVRVMQNETVLPEPALLVTDIAAVGEAGMERPVLLFRRAIAPSGASFYTGSAFPTFQNNFFFATLAGMHIHRVRLDPSTPRRVLFAKTH